MHNIIDPQQQLTTECAAGVRQGEIFGGKAARFEQRHGEASPITSAAVVLEVGASPSGQASFGTFTHR